MTGLHQDLRYLEDRLALFRSEAELRALLKDFRGTVLPARVIGIDSVNPHQSFFIDKGRLDGVTKDMAVCDMTGALIGRTVEPVSFKDAMVQLITDKDSSVGVVSVVARLTGSLAGRSGPTCELRYVLASAAGGEPGEELLTTGTDRIYPAGIRVGRIFSIQLDEDSPIFRKILVEPDFTGRDWLLTAFLRRCYGGAALPRAPEAKCQNPSASTSTATPI